MISWIKMGRISMLRPLMRKLPKREEITNFWQRDSAEHPHDLTCVSRHQRLHSKTMMHAWGQQLSNGNDVSAYLLVPLICSATHCQQLSTVDLSHGARLCGLFQLLPPNGADRCGVHTELEHGVRRALRMAPAKCRQNVMVYLARSHVHFLNVVQESCMPPHMISSTEEDSSTFRFRLQLQFKISEWTEWLRAVEPVNVGAITAQPWRLHICKSSRAPPQNKHLHKHYNR